MPAIYFSLLVIGTSMEPTLHDGHFYATCSVDTVHAGEVVVFRGLRPKEVLVKRVIGVAGDSLGWRFGRPVPSREQRLVIPAGSLYVKSDRYNSRYDSRTFGLVSRERVLGKALLPDQQARKR